MINTDSLSLPSRLFEIAAEYFRNGYLSEALYCFQKVANFLPDSSDVWLNMGAVYHCMGDCKEAMNCFDKAYMLDPATPGLCLRMAVLNAEMGNDDDAEKLFEKALELSPDDEETLYNFSAHHLGRSHFDRSIPILEKLLLLNPQNMDAVCNLGMALKSTGRRNDAMGLYETCCKQGYATDAVRFNLMLLYGNEGMHEACFGIKDELLSSTVSPGLRLRISVYFPPVMPESSEALHTLRSRHAEELQRLINDKNMYGALRLEDVVGNSFYFAYHGENDKPFQVGMAGFLRYACPDLNFVASHCAERKKYVASRKRCRVGVVSSYLREHTIGRLFSNLFARLDRSKFEVIILADKAPMDSISRSLADSAAQYVVLSGSVMNAREVIAGLAPDILMYPDIGMDRFSYALAFARLAPVQCVTWGHPVTSGIDTIDYFISAEGLETLDHDHVYSEKAVLFKNLGIWYERPILSSPRKKRSYYNLPENMRIYFCGQTQFKIHPDFDEIVRRILAEDQQALILLIGSPDRYLHKRITRQNPLFTDRVKFFHSVSRDDFLSLMANADVILDTPHFCGGNTSLEAFAIGMPVVTLHSSYLKGRLTAAMYSRMGIYDCIACSIEEYVGKACIIAGNPEYRRLLGERILSASDVLYKNDAAVCELETFFEGKFCNGKYGK